HIGIYRRFVRTARLKRTCVCGYEEAKSVYALTMILKITSALALLSLAVIPACGSSSSTSNANFDGGAGGGGGGGGGGKTGGRSGGGGGRNPGGQQGRWHRRRLPYLPFRQPVEPRRLRRSGGYRGDEHDLPEHAWNREGACRLGQLQRQLRNPHHGGIRGGGG